MRMSMLAFAFVASAAMAQDYPKLKPGLWESSSRSTAQPKDAPSLAKSMCLDEASAKEIVEASTAAMKSICSRFDVKRDGDRYMSEGVGCKVGQSTMAMKSTWTVTKDSAYRFESSSSFDPPFRGIKEETTTVDAKHVGPCKPGQVPGDVTDAAGKTVNLRNKVQAPAAQKK